MAVEQGLINSGKSLYADDTRADISGAVDDGLKEAEDRRVKKKKEKQDDEDRVYNQRKQEREEELAIADLDSKLTTYAADKGEYMSLIDQGIEQGLLKGPGYDDYLQDRDTWWKDKANQYKVLGDLGNKAAFKKRLGIAAEGEANWGTILQGSGQVAISDSSPDAQKKNIAITAWGKANGDVPPPITSKNGKDFFAIPNADINGDGKIDASDLEGGYDENQVQLIPVADVAGDESGTGIYGDFDERTSFQGFQKDITKDPALYKALEDGYADELDIKLWFDTHADTDIKIKELADSFFQSEGFDPKTWGIEDENNDGEVTAEDLTDKSKIEQIFQGMVEAEYGKQDPSKRPLSLEEQESKADIAYTKSQTFKNYQTNKGDKVNKDELDNITRSYNSWAKSGNVDDLKGLGNIAGVSKDPDSKKNEWILTTKNGKQVRIGGNQNAPNKEAIKNFLGLDTEYETPNQPSAQQFEENVSSYINNFQTNIPGITS